MTHASDREFLVLHALRLKGFADADAVAASAGIDLDKAERHLAGLAERSLAVRREGRITGWSLTPAGREHHAKAVNDEVSVTGGRDAIAACYRRFLDANPELLAVCTAWQVRDGPAGQTLNDHSNPDYDAGVVERLAAVDAAVQPIVADLSAILSRFEPYGGRLAGALAKVRAGDPDWFTKPTCDSYHTVWFELHEDLLATLEIERGTEASAVAGGG